MNRCLILEGIALEEPDDLVGKVEAVGILSVVGLSRQLHRPVRCHEAEALPPVAPGLADVTPFEDHMGHAGLAELVAESETCLPGADDDYAGLVAQEARTLSTDLEFGRPNFQRLAGV